MSKKNIILGVALVVTCVLCVWYVNTPDTTEFSRNRTSTTMGWGLGISGDDRITYIPMNSMPDGYAVGDLVSFTAVSNTSAGDLHRGHYKPVDIRNISRIFSRI